MSTHWVPTLLLGRHTFLSTICISAAYQDAMYRSYVGTVPESVQQLRVRAEVIKMIGRALNSPELRFNDVTIVAVLQVLNGEVIGCNEEGVASHLRGIEKMVKQRGGLGRLGVHGELAMIISM